MRLCCLKPTEDGKMNFGKNTCRVSTVCTIKSTLPKCSLIIFPGITLLFYLSFILILRGHKEVHNKLLEGIWVKHPLNPILGNRSTGSYFDPHVFTKDGLYWMFFSDRNRRSIALTKSFDGQSWSMPTVVLTPSETSGWEGTVNRCSVLYCNNQYYMYYTGQMKGISRIGLATSLDGAHFARIQNDPVLIPEYSYEGNSVMNPFVLFDEHLNMFRMWYSAGETYEPDVICYATSVDGITWVKDVNNPIFMKGCGEYDKAKVSVGHVLKESNQYTMFYISYRTVDHASISVATSKDGIHGWTRLANNPILSPSPGTWDEDSCYKPTVAFSKTLGTWLLWYNGRKKGQESIGLALLKKL